MLYKEFVFSQTKMDQQYNFFEREMEKILKLRAVDNVWCVSFIWGKLNQELIRRRDPIWSADQIQTDLASAQPGSPPTPIFTLSWENIAYLRIDITYLYISRRYFYIFLYKYHTLESRCNCWHGEGQLVGIYFCPSELPSSPSLASCTPQFAYNTHCI